MNIFGENLRSLRSRLFNFNSVHDKNAGKHVTHYFFFVITHGSWAAPAQKFRPGSAPDGMYIDSNSCKRIIFVMMCHLKRVDLTLSIKKSPWIVTNDSLAGKCWRCSFNLQYMQLIFLYGYDAPCTEIPQVLKVWSENGNLKQLTCLDIEMCDNLSEEALTKFLQKFGGNLRGLNLNGIPTVTDTLVSNTISVLSDLRWVENFTLP